MDVKEMKDVEKNSSRCGGSTTRKKNVKRLAKNVPCARLKQNHSASHDLSPHKISQHERGQHKKGINEYNKSQKKQIHLRMKLRN